MSREAASSKTKEDVTIYFCPVGNFTDPEHSEKGGDCQWGVQLLFYSIFLAESGLLRIVRRL